MLGVIVDLNCLSAVLGSGAPCLRHGMASRQAGRQYRCRGGLALQLCEAMLHILMKAVLAECVEGGPGSIALGSVLPALECGLASPSTSS